ncbi:MAG: hypothetical protein IT372_27460 [Polyangiaceae bacterium]|nr:hypothetical protein [Polyangiaceae bacterium]
MSSLLAETQALLEELESSLASTPPEMRGIVEAQIRNLRGSMRMLEEAAPRMEANKRHRPALSAEVRAFFTPQPGPDIPTWVPDTLVRAEAGAHVVRCPPGARVYEDELSVGCAVPRGIGTIPMRHGLSLGFYRSGKLRSQWYYEQGLMRWAIGYHASGGREGFGLYADREEREHLAHGLHTTMCSAGTITTQAWWHLGVRHGWTKMWEEDGYPIGATLYDQDRPLDQVLADGSRRPT